MQTARQLSIVIPTRNEAQTNGETIEQFAPFFEKFDLEVVVSDAGSTDGTAQRVRDAAQKFPDRVVFVQKMGKQNIAIGRNIGTAAASGEILFHTDADVRLPDAGRFF